MQRQHGFLVTSRASSGLVKGGGCCSYVPLLMRSANPAAPAGRSTSPSLSDRRRRGAEESSEGQRISITRLFTTSLCVLGVSSSQLTLSALCGQKAQDTTERMNGVTENHLSRTRRVADTKVKYFALKRPENDSPFTVLRTGTGSRGKLSIILNLDPGPVPLDPIRRSRAAQAVGRDC